MQEPQEFQIEKPCNPGVPEGHNPAEFSFNPAPTLFSNNILIYLNQVRINIVEIKYDRVVICSGSATSLKTISAQKSLRKDLMNEIFMLLKDSQIHIKGFLEMMLLIR